MSCLKLNLRPMMFYRGCKISYSICKRGIIHRHPRLIQALLNKGPPAFNRDSSISFLTWTPFCSRFNQQSSTEDKAFILPDIGEGIREVIIKEWLVSEGSVVKQFDAICEVESDKATATISSRYDGVIAKVHYQVGDMARVGEPLVDIKMAKEVTATLPTSDSKIDEQCPVEKVAPLPVKETRQEQSNVQTLPSVRRLARTHAIDLSKVKATGKRGRLLKEDVLNFMNNQEKSSETKGIENRDEKREIRIPLKGIRRAMFKTMTESLKIPHFSYSDEVDLTRLLSIMKRTAIEGNKISLLAYIIKTVSMALHEYPQLNASVDENGEFLLEKRYHNIGVAIDTNNGLVVPNLKDVQSLSISKVNAELTRLRNLGYEQKLGPSDLSGGTITLSNIGSIGGIFGVPVLMPRECLIGALGKTRQMPRFNSTGNLEARLIMQIVWSADHRVVDGANLSRFSNLLKLLLEEPLFPE